MKTKGKGLRQASIEHSQNGSTSKETTSKAGIKWNPATQTVYFFEKEDGAPKDKQPEQGLRTRSSFSQTAAEKINKLIDMQALKKMRQPSYRIMDPISYEQSVPDIVESPKKKQAPFHRRAVERGAGARRDGEGMWGKGWI